MALATLAKRSKRVARFTERIHRLVCTVNSLHELEVRKKAGALTLSGLDIDPDHLEVQIVWRSCESCYSFSSS